MLAGCSRAPAPAPSGLTPVTLQTDWYAQPEHGGFYQAQVTGIYRAAGLDVSILQGHPNLNPIQVVASGRADFGLSRSDDVITAASRGIPVVMLAALMEKDPQAIMYHEDQGIHSFHDLDGRKLLAVPGLNFIAILEQTQHISLRILPSDFGIARFVADPSMTTQCFVTNEPYYARQAGARVGILMLSDAGISPYRVWFTTRAFLAEHADLARAFTQASLRGWAEYVGGDRAQADARLETLNPRMNPDFIRYCVGAMQSYRLISGDAAAGDAPGRLNPARLADQIRQLSAIGVLAHPVTVADVLP